MNNSLSKKIPTHCLNIEKKLNIYQPQIPENEKKCLVKLIHMLIFIIVISKLYHNYKISPNIQLTCL